MGAGRRPQSVTRVHSPQMRRTVDTFLMNTTPVHTALRALLQGPDRGYDGDLESIVLAYIDRDACSAASAILPDGRWLIHATDEDALMQALNSLMPSMIEGEAGVVRKALEHPFFSLVPKPELREYLHLELPARRTVRGPAGHHRSAQTGDIPRLEQYAREYRAETGDEPHHDWERLIAEGRILLGVFEGAVASVAVRGAETLDRVALEGVFTFRPFRRRGLAKGLVAALGGQAARRGQSTSAIVRKGNDPMLALLEKLHFSVTTEYLIAVFPTTTRSTENDRED